MLLTDVFFLFAMVASFVLGAYLMRGWSFAWRETARRDRIDFRIAKSANWKLAQESFDLNVINAGLLGELKSCKHHANFAIAAEIKLRKQIAELGIEPNA